jgi:hypothetical protein
VSNFFLQLITKAQAQTAPDWRNIGLPEPNPRFNGDIKTLTIQIAVWLFGAVGVLAVIAIVYSGIMYMTAGADTSKAETAKKNIGWAIVGIIIAASAFLIVNTIINELNSL